MVDFLGMIVFLNASKLFVSNTSKLSVSDSLTKKELPGKANTKVATKAVTEAEQFQKALL